MLKIPLVKPEVFFNVNIYESLLKLSFKSKAFLLITLHKYLITISFNIKLGGIVYGTIAY